jgi:hypothetical protein
MKKTSSVLLFLIFSLASFAQETDYEIKTNIPYYSDSILYYADTRQELEELCNEKGWELKPIHVWNEYYIGVSK